MLRTRPFKKTVLKLILPSVLMVLLTLFAIFFIFIPMAEKAALKKKEETLKNLIQVASSSLVYYHELETKNACSLALAQESAKNHIRSLRYGKEQKQYFWIIDQHGTNIVHPYRPDFEGVSNINLTDADGKMFIRDIIHTVRNDGEGFVFYKWQVNDNPDLVEKKIVYVKIFAPWGWIIGTGVYMDDIKLDIASATWTILLTIVMITVLVAIVYTFVVKDLLSIEKKRESSVEQLMLKSSKKQTLLEAIPDMIMRIDRNGVVLDYKEPLGVSPFIDPAEILDNRIADTWPDDIAEQVLAAIEKVFETSSLQMIVLHYEKSPSEIIIIESHFVLSDENEVLATFRDITKRSL